MSKIHTNPDHLRRSGSNLSRFGQTVSEAGGRLNTTGQNLVEHARGDRSGIGEVVANSMGRGTEIAGKVFQEGGRVADRSGQNLIETGNLHERADRAGERGLLRHEPKNETEHVHGGGERSGSKVGGGGREEEPPKVGGGGGNGPNNPPPPGGGGGGGSNPPHLPRGGGEKDDGPFSKPLTADTKKLEQIDESRVTRSNGLITHVDGKPVEQYTTEVARGRAQQFHDAQKAEVEQRGRLDDENARRKAEYQAQRAEYKRQVDELKAQGRQREIGSLEKPKPPKLLDPQPGVSSNTIGQVTAVSIDRRTGAIWEGANGHTDDHADPLHPALRANYEKTKALRADPEQGMHPDHPLGHAEVKAVNAALWERQRMWEAGELDHPPTAADLPEMRVDNYFPFGPEVRQAPCCANCNVTLEGVPSNAGRLKRYPAGKDDFVAE